MTCIVGIVDKNKDIWIGGDSAGSSGHIRYKRRDKKVFINGDFIMGFTSSFRMGQLLHYKFIPPYHKSNQSIFKYMVGDFMDEVRKCLKENGYAKVEKNEESIGTFIVGYKGRLFNVEDDLQVAEYYDDFIAVGCGDEFARGSLYTSKDFLPKERILLALKAAEEFSGWVSKPFNILKLKYQNK